MQGKGKFQVLVALVTGEQSPRYPVDWSAGGEGGEAAETV
jgi:hypothetical protein